MLTPDEIIRLLETAYGEFVHRHHRDGVSELVLTVLSQNTSDTNSGRAFHRLLDRYAIWDEVRTAPLPDLVETIRPGGLAEQKAPRIQAILEEVRARTGGYNLDFLADLPLPEAKAWLRSLPGVGPKTAACVLLFALGRPALPVDTHVHRVAGRLGLIPPKLPAEAAHERLEGMLWPEQVYPFHVGLIKHGRWTCKAQRPECARCVLRHGCPSAFIAAGAPAPAADPP